MGDIGAVVTSILMLAWDGAEKLGGLGQVAAAFLAGYALSYAKRQISVTAVAQKEATLRELNRDQNRLSFENPKFARPALLETIDYAGKTIGGDAVEFERYYWFVVIGLAVCERAAVDGVKQGWDYSINDFLRTHQDFLSHQSLDFWNDYDKALQDRWRKLSG